MRAISVIVESYHDELWLDGRCDSDSNLLSEGIDIDIDIDVVILGEARHPLYCYFIFPPRLFTSWESRGIMSCGDQLV